MRGTDRNSRASTANRASTSASTHSSMISFSSRRSFAALSSRSSRIESSAMREHEARCRIRRVRRSSAVPRTITGSTATQTSQGAVKSFTVTDGLNNSTKVLG